MFSLNVTAYNGATEGQNYSNMSCVDTQIDLNLGRVRVVFLMKFVNNLLVSNLLLSTISSARNLLKWVPSKFL